MDPVCEQGDKDSWLWAEIKTREYGETVGCGEREIRIVGCEEIKIVGCGEIYGMWAVENVEREIRNAGCGDCGER